MKTHDDEVQNLNYYLLKPLSSKMAASADKIESCFQALMHEPINLTLINGIVIESYECLDTPPEEVHHYVKDFVHENDKACQIIDDNIDVFKCEVRNYVIPRACLDYEKVIYDSCKVDMCRHFSANVEKDKTCCVFCCKEKLLFGVSD